MNILCTVFGVLAIAHLALSSSPDPCLPSNHRNITSIGQRYQQNTECSSAGDFRLPRTWYYAGDDRILTWNPADHCQCGVLFPIWMNGSLPLTTDGVVSRKVCLFMSASNPCKEFVSPQTIQVKHCGRFFVYKLMPTVFDKSAYCFGVEKPADKDSTTTGTSSRTEQTTAAPLTIHASILILAGSVTEDGFYIDVNCSYDPTIVSTWLQVLSDDSNVVRNVSIHTSIVTYTVSDLEHGAYYSARLFATYRHESSVLAELSVYTKPSINATLGRTNSSGIDTSFAQFICCFQRSNTVELKAIRWHIVKDNGNTTTIDIDDHNGSLALTEFILQQYKVHLPFNVTCSMVMKTENLTKLYIPFSRPLFAGVKVLDTSVTLYRNEMKRIRLVPTIPIGCVTMFGPCKVTLDIAIPTHKQCSGIATRNCAVRLHGDIINEIHNFTIQAAEDGQYSILRSTTYNVNLKTRPLLDNYIWSRYTLPPVKVTILPELETYWRGKRCDALNDPHMFSFDGRRYEHHESAADEYILYKHITYGVEVHHKLERCNRNAMCNCGVAVKAGRDVYVVSACNNRLQIGYKQCDDGVLVVKKESDFAYSIYVPYGTVIKARLDRIPWADSVGVMIVSVSILPSVHDQHGRSRGLCGTLDEDQSNDFHDTGGVVITDRLHFIRAWSVESTGSLFGQRMSSLEPWQYPICTCTGEAESKLQCKLGADDSCSRGRRVGLDTCLVEKNVSLSKTEHTQPTSLGLLSTQFTSPVTTGTTTIASTTKQHTPLTTRSSSQGTIWNHTAATQECQAYFDMTRTFKLCSKVPDTDTVRSMETCVQDILLTQTNVWTSISKQSMQDSCLAEIRRNTTVREHEQQETSAINTIPPSMAAHISGTQQSPPDITRELAQIINTIEQIACPNECNSNGQCINGTCECHSGYGADDCSIHTNVAPRLDIIVQGKACDERITTCNAVVIRGGMFTETVTCHITEQYVNKDQVVYNNFTTKGQSEALTEVVCPLISDTDRHHEQSRTLIQYLVSVSNDGIHHGPYLHVYVYNSQCHVIHYDNSTVDVTIKEKFCYIDNKCYKHGVIGPSSNLYCNANESANQWSTSQSSVTSTGTSSTVTARQHTASTTVQFTNEPTGQTTATPRVLTANINILLASVTDIDFTVNVNCHYNPSVESTRLNILTNDDFLVKNISINERDAIYHVTGLQYGTYYSAKLYTTNNDITQLLDDQSIYTKPHIDVNLGWTLSNGMNKTFTQFKCMFHRSTNVLTYATHWRINDNGHQTFITIPDNNGSLELTETQLEKHGVHLPFNITCSISGRGLMRRNISSPFSEPLFAGIKVLETSLSLYRNEMKSIRVIPTIPIGCIDMTDSCTTTLDIYIPTHKQCSGIATRACGIVLHGDKIGHVHNFTIQAAEDGQYSILKSTTYDVILKTRASLENYIWNNYFLNPIKVTILPERETYWRGKRCDALNDPHMFTFDGRRYEHHESMTEYILYKHVTYDVEVHHKLERCNRNAMCNCGVTVKAGRDVYVVSTCNNRLQIGYIQCDDGVLVVKKESDMTYSVYLPYGTVIKARLDRVPYSNSVGVMIVSVSILPSVHDQHGRSRGLCGTLDNDQTNDFHDTAGGHLSSRRSFIASWRVRQVDSQFRQHVHSNTPWQHPICACSDLVQDKLQCKLGADDSCSRGRRVGYDTCQMEKNVTLVGDRPAPAQDLETFSTQFTSSVYVDTTPSVVTAHLSATYQNQTTTSPPVQIWNLTSATEACDRHFHASRTYRLCSKVPDTDTVRSMETCVQDILLTQSNHWTSISKQSMQDSCLSEIRRNTTVRQHQLQQPSSTVSNTIRPSAAFHTGTYPSYTSTEASIFSVDDLEKVIETIEQIACPNECLNHGDCKSGKCICYSGYGADDCSINTKEAPRVSEVLQGSACDERLTRCSRMFIQGGLFTAEVTCHITEISYYLDGGLRTETRTFVTKGTSQSLIEVECPLKERIVRRSITQPKQLTEYHVAVSNDGIHHGPQLDMLVFNSICQDVHKTNDNLTVVIKDGYCFIDERCFKHGDTGPSSTLYCNTKGSIYRWSIIETTANVPTTNVEAQSTVLPNRPSESLNWIVPVIAALCGVVIVTLIVTVVIYFKLRKQSYTPSAKSDTMPATDNIAPDPYDADMDEDSYACIGDVMDNPIYMGDKYDHLSAYDSLNTTQVNTSNAHEYIKLGALSVKKSGEDTALGYERFQSRGENVVDQEYERPNVVDQGYERPMSAKDRQLRPHLPDR